VESFARVSAISIPGIFWWPGTQRKRISQPEAVSVEQRRAILFEKLCFFQFQVVIDCSELRLSVTIPTLTIFNEETRYNAWRMAKSSEVMEKESLFIAIEYFRFLSAM